MKSFGTEKRETERHVPPRDETYEYIIFRGTDIEDLTVCEAPTVAPQPLHPDPAIVQVSCFKATSIFLFFIYLSGWPPSVTLVCIFAF